MLRQEHQNAPMKPGPEDIVLTSDDIFKGTVPPGKKLWVNMRGLVHPFHTMCKLVRAHPRTSRKRLKAGWPIWKIFRDRDRDIDPNTGRVMRRFS